MTEAEWLADDGDDFLRLVKYAANKASARKLRLFAVGSCQLIRSLITHKVYRTAVEVAEAFEVPLQFLMNPANHQHHEFEFGGARRRFLSMPWRPGHGDPREYFIWGATAAMLRNLYHLLSD